MSSSAKQVADVADDRVIRKAPVFNHYSPRNDHYDAPSSLPVQLPPPNHDQYRSMPNLPRHRLASPPSPPPPPLPMRTSFRLAVDKAYDVPTSVTATSGQQQPAAGYRGSNNYIDMQLKASNLPVTADEYEAAENPYADLSTVDSTRYVNNRPQYNAIGSYDNSAADYENAKRTQFSYQNYEPMYAPPPHDTEYAPLPRDTEYAPPPYDTQYAPLPRDIHQTHGMNYENVGAQTTENDVMERDYLAFMSRAQTSRRHSQLNTAISEENIYASIAAPESVHSGGHERPPLFGSDSEDSCLRGSGGGAQPRPWYSGTDTGSEQVSRTTRASEDGLVDIFIE